MERLHELVRVTRNELNEYKVEVGNLAGMSSERELHATLAQNMKDLVSELSQNSPLRGPLLSILSSGVKKSTFCNFFSISSTTFHRIQNVTLEDKDKYIYVRYALDCNRQRLDEVHINLITEFLNLAMPTVSGREYRVLIGTFNNLYAAYESYLEDINQCDFTVCRSFLRQHIKQYKI